MNVCVLCVCYALSVCSVWVWVCVCYALSVYLVWVWVCVCYALCVFGVGVGVCMFVCESKYQQWPAQRQMYSVSGHVAYRDSSYWTVP